MEEKVKITALISRDIEDELREYIQKTYKRPYGKLSELVEESLKLYLKIQKESNEKISE